MITINNSKAEQIKTRAAEIVVQNHLDEQARTKGYDDIKSASQYAALPAGEPFQAEGVAFLRWRAQCWARCYEILDAVKAGTMPEPTRQTLIAEMPLLVLP